MCDVSFDQPKVYGREEDHPVIPCYRCGYNVLKGDQCGNCGSANP